MIKVKKFLLASIITLSICSGITGCDEVDIRQINCYHGNEYFDLTYIYRGEFDIAYDKNTKVMYALVDSGYQFGITPIYNTDGSLKLYKENNQ